MPTGIYPHRPLSEETKRKISKSNKGHLPWITGKHHTEKTKKKMSEWQKGDKSLNYGVPLPLETRIKIGLANKGHGTSEETRRKIGDAHRGKEISEETRKKSSIANKGKIITEETRRKISETQKSRVITCQERDRMRAAQSGPNGSNWKGGISFEPYCPKFTKEFRERVRAFFGHVCVGCGIPQNGERLHIHHVNFNKEACCDSSIPLFVPLCRSCHGKSQHNRIFWQYWFTEIINRQYGGKCFIPQVRTNESQLSLPARA